ncbi:hypothetical protein [Candidatus Macondimonas diazotrophica]|jgi:hypothetical protein|uniref:Uncharacterized protein n=1 Tax=Candidatus Macondimonas diazotrophica TaxID=2305248 RepID=A0A4Z0F7E2_9GAMM|nr:hypothetical protein [Candidatus Macondimonas diazotrophica]TFZ81619.1 hypothetical protein E4680_11595 [Candidatus Macondimonas diazotrophica]
MLAPLATILLAAQMSYQASFTSSRVLSDIDLHISDSRRGSAIYIGDCNGYGNRERIMIRLVDTSAEADITGYIVERRERADYVFCTG